MTSETSTSTEAVHRCLSCGRRITSAESVAAGRGSGCRAKIRKAARTADLSAWTERQLEQARELIEDGALVPAEEDGVFLAVSTDGTEVHRCAVGVLPVPDRPEGRPVLPRRRGDDRDRREHPDIPRCPAACAGRLTPD
jgi:hypothetical protein